MKTIAAYRSGLQIDTEVSKADAEKGLLADVNGKYREISFRSMSFWNMYGELFN